MADKAVAYPAGGGTASVFYAFGQNPTQVAELLLDQYVGRTLGGNKVRATQLILEVGFSSAGDEEGNPYEGTLLVVW